MNELHELLAEVMIRNRRSTVGLQFTRRWARTESLSLSPPELSLYQDVTEFVRDHLRTVQAKQLSKTKDNPKEGATLNRMALVSLQMAMGSSSQAAAGTLRKIAEQPKLSEGDRARLSELADRALAQHESTKVNRLLGLLDEVNDKMVIFTQFAPPNICWSAGSRKPGITSRCSTEDCRVWKKKRPSSSSVGRPVSCFAQRLAARGVTSSSLTLFAILTSPGIP